MSNFYNAVVTTVGISCGFCEDSLVSSTDHKSTILCEGEFCYCNNPDCKKYKKKILVNHLANYIFPITQETKTEQIKFKKQGVKKNEIQNN